MKRNTFRLQLVTKAALLVFSGLGSLVAAEPITHTIELTPEHRTNQWQVDLSPAQTAQLTVTIAATGEAEGRNWQIKGTPQVTITGDNFLWTGSLTGLSGVFSVVNTAPGTTPAKVEVSCEWVASAATASAGGGGAGAPATLKGLASGVAIPGVQLVSWSFYPVRQAANGISAINWTVYFYDSEGEPLETEVGGVQALALNPTETGWTITPGTGSGSLLSGTVTSSVVSTGRMAVRYNGDSNAESHTVLTFGTGPWLEVYTPLE